MTDYLGQGIKYPLQLVAGRVNTVSDVDNINQSLYNIFSTPKGSNLMNREYGFRGHELSFEPNDSVLESMLRLFIEEAIVAFEPRVRFKKAAFSTEADRCTMAVYYEIRSSKELGFFGYPFNRNLT